LSLQQPVPSKIGMESCCSCIIEIGKNLLCVWINQGRPVITFKNYLRRPACLASTSFSRRLSSDLSNKSLVYVLFIAGNL